MRDNVTNNVDHNRYELALDNQIAIAAYQRRGNIVTFTHTEVPSSLAGKGVGSRLIEGALADVRAQGLQIAATCSFVSDYLDRHPDAQDLIA